MEHIIRRIADGLSPIPCVRAVTLGGARAASMQDSACSIDAVIYYDANRLDLPALNAAAKQLDDAARSGLIGPPGSWGHWANCGGFATVGGMQTSVILRDVSLVSRCIEETDRGDISMHYQTGHPHMFSNVMYRAELASSRTLYAADDAFGSLKAHARAYPDALANALIGFFLFEASLSYDLAKKAAASLDLYSLTGHLFRGVSALNQVIFALNRTYCPNEKKALAKISAMTYAPEKYKARAEALLSCPACGDALRMLGRLIDDVSRLLPKGSR